MQSTIFKTCNDKLPLERFIGKLHDPKAGKILLRNGKVCNIEIVTANIPIEDAYSSWHLDLSLLGLAYLHVCREWKCEVDGRSRSTGVNPSRKQKCWAQSCHWSQNLGIHLTQVFLKVSKWSSFHYITYKAKVLLILFTIKNYLPTTMCSRTLFIFMLKQFTEKIKYNHDILCNSW